MAKQVTWQSWELETAGKGIPLYVHCLYSRCGDIRHGVALRDGALGAPYVVALASLKRLVREAESVQREADRKTHRKNRKD